MTYHDVNSVNSSRGRAREREIPDPASCCVMRHGGQGGAQLTLFSGPMPPVDAGYHVYCESCGEPYPVNGSELANRDGDLCEDCADAEPADIVELLRHTERGKPVWLLPEEHAAFHTWLETTDIEGSYVPKYGIWPYGELSWHPLIARNQAELAVMMKARWERERPKRRA